MNRTKVSEVVINTQQYTIEELIPHSPPMVLIDRIIEHDDQGLIAEIDISPKSLFFDKQIDGVPSWVGIEYMAQAIAALAGIRAKMSGQPIKLGFLLGTRKYHMYEKRFLAGHSYQIKVSQLYMDDSGLASFDCSIGLNQSVLAQAKLNVFETDDAQQVINH